MRRLLPIVLAGLLSASPAKAAEAPVTQAELDTFVKGAEQRDPAMLQALFGKRMLRSRTAADRKLATADSFIEAIEGCRRHRITRFPDAADVYVLFVCPDRPHRGPTNTLSGYVARLWHHEQLGLSLHFAQDEIALGPLMAPGAPRN